MSANSGGSVTPASGWFNGGQNVAISAQATSNYSFSSWSGTGNGSYSGFNNPWQVTMNAAISEVASFTQNAVQVTIQTSPPGRSFYFDFVRYTTSQTRTIQPGEELAYDYQIQRDPEDPPDVDVIFACRCGAATCRGSMLVAPKKPRKKAVAKTAKKPAKKAKKKSRAAGRGARRSAARRVPASRKAQSGRPWAGAVTRRTHAEKRRGAAR